jgi:hypothetical protein
MPGGVPLPGDGVEHRGGHLDARVGLISLRYASTSRVDANPGPFVGPMCARGVCRGSLEVRTFSLLNGREPVVSV